MRWKQDTVTRDNHRTARLGAVLSELCKSWTKRKKIGGWAASASKDSITTVLGEEIMKGDCSCTYATLEGFWEFPRVCRPEILMSAKYCETVVDVCVLSRKLKIQWVWHLFSLTSDTFQARILGWTGGCWDVNLVVMRPDNCMHTYTAWPLKCWRLKIWKGKKSGPTFDTIVKDLHCFWRLPYVCPFFKVRATRFFPISLPELLCLGKY